MSKNLNDLNQTIFCQIYQENCSIKSKSEKDNPSQNKVTSKDQLIKTVTMAEYNTNPFNTNSKPNDVPYLTNGNRLPNLKKNVQAMEMRNATAAQGTCNSNQLIRNDDILIIQNTGKNNQQKLESSSSNNNPNPPNQTNPQSQPTVTRRKLSPLRFSQPATYYPGNSYIYPYYYDSSGCYYCCWCNGNCFPCETCHNCGCSQILCDPFPCCNGCNGLHCGCLQCLSPCHAFDCVKQNNCQCCNFLPCCSGCQFCSQACDGTCISAIPCCNGCQCGYLCHLIPCCNGCECEHLFGCLPCCNDAICNVCNCLQGCQIFNCLDNCCGNGFQCLGNCDCGNCDCNGLDCNGCDCNALDCNGCDCNGCDLGGCDLSSCC